MTSNTSPPVTADNRSTAAPHLEPADAPIRCVSIDVEEYFQIEVARDVVGHKRWDDWPSRVQRNMDLLLDLFERTHCRATFFFLGSIAKRHPQLARRCVGLGHEVASHGTMHDRLHRLTPESMLKDVQDSKHLLEDQTGKPVLGYRAPTWSITRQTSWAVDVLAEAGLRYDASVFPVRHPDYGVPDAPDRPYFIQSSPGSARLLELPPLTWRIGSRNIAVAGGGYFRLYPLTLMKRGLRQAALEQRPAILYFHPWEFDPGMPRLPLSATGKLRTYTGLRSAAAKLEKVIRAFDSTHGIETGEDSGGGANVGEGKACGGWRPIGERLAQFEKMAEKTGVFTLQQQAAG